MNFFSVPKTDYENHYDRARYKLQWSMTLVFVVLMSLVSISNLTNPNYTSIPNFIAVSVGGISLFVLIKKRKYEWISFISAIINFLIISATFFWVENAVHYTTPMWMILNILFAFFMLGNRWGLVFLTLHFIIACCYIWFKLTSNLAHLPEFGIRDLWNFIIEFAICGGGIGYIIFQFVQTTTDAENRFLTTNTELNEQNLIITNQNAEKEVMLKEIHHRVKNNLQVITSLLRLQSYELEDNRSVKEFSESINRVKAMALIHEKMYQTSELSNLNLEGYIQSLADDLIASYSVEIPVDLKVESTLQRVGSKTLVPLALLFNELISNSIKHAFLGRESGLIRITISSNENKTFKLSYIDNGNWKEPAKGNSFGAELIHLMTDQLEGKMTRESSENGTSYTFYLKDIEEDHSFMNN